MPTPERLHLARELHDGIAQDLVGLGYSLDLLIAQSDLPLEVRSSLRSSRLHIDELMYKVRSEIFNLRTAPSQPLREILLETIEPYKNDFTISLNLEEVTATAEISETIAACALEILRNIQTHARATHIVLALYAVNNRTCLQVSDNGIGGVTLKQGHWGITGMSEKIAALGGSILIEDGFIDNKGVRITILL